MKVWGVGIIYKGQSKRAIIAAKTRAEAARSLGMSDRHLKTYGSTTGNGEEITQAMSKPGAVFIRERDWHGPFIEIKLRRDQGGLNVG